MTGHRPFVPVVAVLAAAAATLNVLAATPASAAAPYRNWYATSCATGGFDPVDIGAGGNLVIPAQVTNCGIQASKYAFTVVSFRADRELAFAFSSGLRPYAVQGPAEVNAAFVTRPAAGTTGVCLMRSTTARIACLAVDVGAHDQITTRPLSTEDPLVTKPVLFQDDALSPEPGTSFCATCVSLP